MPNATPPSQVVDLVESTSPRARALWHAVQTEDEAAVSMALSSDASPDAALRLGKKGVVMPALHVCVAKGHRGIADLLLRAGCSVNQRSSDGTCALHICSHQGDAQMVRMLLGGGASPDTAANGFTPMLMALANRHHSVALELIAGKADVNVSGANGTAPLGLACYVGDLTAVDFLLKAGADLSL